MDNGRIRGGVVYKRRTGEWTLGESGVEECTWSMRGGIKGEVHMIYYGRNRG